MEGVGYSCELKVKQCVSPGLQIHFGRRCLVTVGSIFLYNILVPVFFEGLLCMFDEYRSIF